MTDFLQLRIDELYTAISQEIKAGQETKEALGTKKVEETKGS
jgi:hypothetical protein